MFLFLKLVLNLLLLLFLLLLLTFLLLLLLLKLLLLQVVTLRGLQQMYGVIRLREFLLSFEPAFVGFTVCLEKGVGLARL